MGYYLAAGCGALTDVLIFLVLTSLGLTLSIAAVCSTAIGATISYLINAKFVFKSNASFPSFSRFMAVGIAATALAGVGVPFLSEIVDSALIGKLAWMVLQAGAQFFLHATWTFRPLK